MWIEIGGNLVNLDNILGVSKHGALAINFIGMGINLSVQFDLPGERDRVHTILLAFIEPALISSAPEPNQLIV